MVTLSVLTAMLLAHTVRLEVIAQRVGENTVLTETENPLAASCLATGTVTVEDTDEPLEGFVVKVVTGRPKLAFGSQPYQTVEATTDDKGRFSIGIPRGHGWFATPEIPAGHWTWQDSSSLHRFVTSPDEPIVSKHYKVNHGAVVTVRVFDGLTKAPIEGVGVGGNQRKGNRFLITTGDIVFLGIHTAGTDMSQVQDLLALEKWDLVTGIDEGRDTKRIHRKAIPSPRISNHRHRGPSWQHLLQFKC